MPTSIRRIALAATLATAGLLAGAAPARNPAQPIVTGDGEITNTVVGPVAVEFALVELPDGSLQGEGMVAFAATSGWVTFDLTSSMFLDGKLAMAGSVTSSFDAPPSDFVDATLVFAVDDGGSGAGADKLAGTVGPRGLTIQQVVAFIGPPPPQAYQPVVTGNFKIH